jgi:archaellum biogenesis protein FlaJ (TadC family)
MATAPNFVAEIVDKPPIKEPIGVRTAEIIYTSLVIIQIFSEGIKFMLMTGGKKRNICYFKAIFYTFVACQLILIIHFGFCSPVLYLLILQRGITMLKMIGLINKVNS